MAEAELKKLAQTLAEIQAIKFGSFKLTSGKLSPYYIDLRLVPSHPQAFRLCVEAYQRLVRQIGLEAFDLMVGVPTAGVVFASVAAGIALSARSAVRSRRAVRPKRRIHRKRPAYRYRVNRRYGGRRLGI